MQSAKNQVGSRHFMSRTWPLLEHSQSVTVITT
jgi:hypothetical protein